MSKLSSHISTLKPAYDVIVIGSGYGGSIAASRMSRAGKRVCLLEKGKEFHPGKFPSSIADATKEFQVNTVKKQRGSATGLYDFTIGENISVFKGCGLGGTSLVNANVAIEPEDRVFQDEKWPKELRDDLSSFREGVQRAKHMLQSTPYPEGKKDYPELAKTKAMKDTAAAMGETFKFLDINVTFEDKINHVGVKQNKCINCGDCVTGCNHKAKNTTQMNYLPDAKNHGAEIFTEVEVKYIKKNNSNWFVYFQIHETGREKFDSPLLFIKANMVFLGAGSLGSTEILLRSAKQGLALSNMLGKRFTGNGDVLGFGYNTDVKIHGIGKGDNNVPHPVGPCITSVIDMREQENLEDGMVIEEGSAPGPIGSILKAGLLPFSRLIGKDTDAGFKDFIKEKYREIISFFKGPYHGALDHTQVYLVMTHDDGKGKMQLNKDRLQLSWEDVGEQEIFKKVNTNLLKATKSLGGNYVKNPSWTKLMDYSLVTVHPLGGCIMGDDATTGVVNHKGEVYAGNTGKTVHSGLYVQDGAIIPRSLGANPLLTISGLAERNCEIIAQEMGVTVDYSFPVVKESKNQIINPGVQFTEAMKGYFSTNEKDDFNLGLEAGKSENSPFEFMLTIHSDDIDQFIQDKAHEATMIGSVLAPALSNAPLTVLNGKFNLFIQDEQSSDRKKMLYHMTMHSIEGQTFYFAGFKDIHDDKGLDVWTDTTKLFITVYEGENDEGAIIGKGILKIEINDFRKQLTTIKATNTDVATEKLAAIAKFGKLFAGNVWETYV